MKIMWALRPYKSLSSMQLDELWLSIIIVMGALIYYCMGKIEALEEKLYQLKNQNENAENRIDGEDRRRDGHHQDRREQGV